MNLLNELPVGNAFKSSNDISFRCKGNISSNYIPIIPIKQYFLINKETEVVPLSNVKEYAAGVILTLPQSNLIKNIPTGTIAWTRNPLGLNQYIIITNTVKDNVLMVAALGEPKLMPAVSRIVDLGPVEEYPGPNIAFDMLRTCPNCGNLSYKATPDINDNGILEIIGECYNCGCTIKITW